MKTETKQCNKCKEDFILDEDDFSFYKKMKVPPPNVCPACRFKMRAMWRNETTLYSGQKCDLCKKNIVTMYNPKSLYTIYCLDCYFSDKWNSQDYAVDYNFNLSFFEQLSSLFKKVPKMAVFRTSGAGLNVNSEYVNMSGGVKNCYLLFNSGPDEECMYSRGIKDCEEVVDAYFGTKSSLCYEVVNIQESNKIVYGQNIIGSVDCYFSKNLSGCINCLGCVNLRNKSNYFLNKSITQEEFKKKVNEIVGSYKKMEEFKDEFKKLISQTPFRENNNLKTVNSTGDYLYEVKNVFDSFEVTKSENCKHLFSSKEIKDSIGTTGYGFRSELLCECVAVGYASNVISSCYVDQSQNIQYSFFCNKNNNNLFGCDGLKNAKYCILNKQYAKEEYEKIKDHIVKELTEQGIYGLMVPPEIAPFAYNETIAQDNMPLTKEEAIAQGFRWEDDIQMTIDKETLQPEEIPDHINDVQDSITNEILKCIDCQRNYKIIEQELLFYRKMILPIPRKCFFCRHIDRIKRRGPFKFFFRKCDNCGIKTHTNLTKEVAPIMYCEKCYQKEII